MVTVLAQTVSFWLLLVLALSPLSPLSPHSLFLPTKRETPFSIRFHLGIFFVAFHASNVEDIVTSKGSIKRKSGEDIRQLL